MACLKKRFRMSAFPAKLERTKVLVPRSLGYIRLRLYPNSQSIEILQTDLAVMHTFLPDGRESLPAAATAFRSVASFTEHKATEFIAQTLHLFGIAGSTESFGQLEKCAFFLLADFDSLFDQFHQNSVIAKAALLRHRIYLPGDVGRKRHASTHVFSRFPFCHCHCIIIHHNGAAIKPDGRARASTFPLFVRIIIVIILIGRLIQAVPIAPDSLVPVFRLHHAADVAAVAPKARQSEDNDAQAPPWIQKLPLDEFVSP